MRKLKGTVKETAKQKRERKQEFVKMRQQIHTIALPALGVIFLLICTKVLNMFAWAFISGTCAATGSALGKLSGAVYGSTIASWIASGTLLVLMIVVNTAGCRYYVRALDAAASSLIPTIVSAAVAYVVSGVGGALVFGEKNSIMWWTGAALVSIGLTLLVPSTSHQHSS